MIGGRKGRRLAMWAGLAVGWVLPTTGCQVEYAGMTLPSGKYMFDDVQYFPPGPDFPWANTQAATQRARMRAMGIEPEVGPVGGTTPPAAGGTLDPRQNIPGRPTNVNTLEPEAPINPPAPAPGGAPAPGVPAPEGAAGGVGTLPR